MTSPKTIGQWARENGVPLWKVRRTADSLGVPIPRVGLYRIIPPEVEFPLRVELRRTGWISGESPAAQEAIPC